MKILVCGDRNWTNRKRLETVLDAFADKMTILIEGEAKGADTMAREWAEKRGIPVERHPADWGQYGKAAGPIRNLAMLHSGPGLVISFHNHFEESKGTKHMVTIAKKLDVRCVLFTDRYINGEIL